RTVRVGNADLRSGALRRPAPPLRFYSVHRRGHRSVSIPRRQAYGVPTKVAPPPGPPAPPGPPTVRTPGTEARAVVAGSSTTSPSFRPDTISVEVSLAMPICTILVSGPFAPITCT